MICLVLNMISLYHDNMKQQNKLDRIVPVQVMVTKEVHEKAKIACIKRGITLSEYLREALDKLIKKAESEK